MADLALFRDLALALALGLLIGLERGWSARGEPAGSRVAGFRTFGLVGLVGGLAGIVAARIALPLAVAIVVAAAAALIAGYIRDMRLDGHVSATSTVAAFATLAIGLLATSGMPVVAAVTGGVMLLLLSMRAELHAWIRGLEAHEIKAVARFALIAIVVWPLLPDARYGPYDAWNPRELWFVVVLVSGLSFAGYVAAKRFGAVKGILATAAIGATFSSTAVTAALARRLREGDAQPPLIAGIAAAGAVMMLRVMLLAGILAGFALPALMWTAIPGALAAAAAALLALRGDGDDAGKPMPLPRNPFDLWPALAFAALLAGAALFARWATDAFGDQGLAVVLAITGAFDVDAAIVTMGGMPAGSVEPRLAGMILAIPILLNTAFKAMITIGIAGWRAGRGAAATLVFSLLAGLGGLVALWLT